jgi:hypothetical protein
MHCTSLYTCRVYSESGCAITAYISVYCVDGTLGVTRDVRLTQAAALDLEFCYAVEIISICSEYTHLLVRG